MQAGRSLNRRLVMRLGFNTSQRRRKRQEPPKIVRAVNLQPKLLMSATAMQAATLYYIMRYERNRVDIAPLPYIAPVHRFTKDVIL
ncbi:protein of unknown function (plasmid) [Cupriavidus taiwanensis]|uniref:Uncharacterized protein n=1 Tax=Cupriavidus taiwanensis TaxID=164546 RepID=A0A375EFX9_9BURK|nr:protein of unknown function [Cupriavidus taiwanensis]SOZ72003.1 protein of unknown function [Cupriavidus taiwanensis]SOZ74354.1 protein of unknown function [Cupriavidus taiwanensis]SPA03261.1 protein of unknown function [Cupriavidus taiwanensis]SPA11242.1 protein of unknown function [Cupriavidus taiwanensis]